MRTFVGFVICIGTGIPGGKEQYTVFLFGRERPDDVANGQVAAVVGSDGTLLHLDRGPVTGQLGSQIVGRSPMGRGIGNPVSKRDLTLDIGIGTVGIEHGNLYRVAPGIVRFTTRSRLGRTGNQPYNQNQKSQLTV